MRSVHCIISIKNLVVLFLSALKHSLVGFKPCPPLRKAVGINTRVRFGTHSVSETIACVVQCKESIFADKHPLFSFWIRFG